MPLYSALFAWLQRCLYAINRTHHGKPATGWHHDQTAKLRPISDRDRRASTAVSEKPPAVVFTDPAFLAVTRLHRL
jgi:hypothetical protein